MVSFCFARVRATEFGPSSLKRALKTALMAKPPTWSCEVGPGAMTKVGLRRGVAFRILPAGPAVSAAFSTRTDVRRAVAAVIVALSLAWPAAEAMARCAPAAVAGGSPSNTTVTCTGRVTNQNGNTGFGTGEQNNDTINVLAATTVTGSGPSPNIGAGLNLGTGNTVNLTATTSNVTGGNDGILTAGSITIMSSGTIFGSNAAILIFGTTTASNIVNSGTISSPADTIGASGALNVTNSSSGIIQSTGPTGGAIAANDTLTVNNAGIIRQAGVGMGSLGLLGPAGAMTNVTNSGTISGGMAAIDALGGATVINSGNLLAGMAGVATVGTTIVTNTQGGVIQATTAGASAGVLAMSLTAPATVTNAGTISGNLDGVNTNTSATTTISNSGMINGTTRDGLRVNSATFTNAAGGTLTGATGILFRAAAGTSSITNSGTITGTGGIAIDASAALGTVTTNQTAGTINGAIKLSANADVLNISGGTIAGNIVGQGTSNTINFAAGSGTFTYGSAFNFSTINQVNVSSGTAILDGTNSAAHVTVNGGALQIGDAANPGATLTSASPVDVVGGMLVGNGTLIGSTTIEKGGTLSITSAGSIAGDVLNNATFLNAGTVAGQLTNNSGITVNNGALNGGAIVNGGVLTGTGSIANTTVNGGVFAPGNGTAGSSIAVTGNLAFQSAAQYLVLVNPSTTSSTSVTGTATLGGATVDAVFANGTFVAKQYAILTAGSRSGSFASSVVSTNLPSGFTTSLSYDSTHAFLDLTLSFTPPGTGFSGNQQNVANGLANFFNTSGSIPGLFGALSPASLAQISGETATGSQQTTFNAMTQFLGILLDPFIDGRGGALGGTRAPAFAAEGEDDNASAYARKRSKNERDASGIFTKAAAPFEARWSTWAAGFGGSQTTDGNAAVGSNIVTSRIFGTAAGADYHFSPSTVAGFAVAGGGTSFSVANNGTGRSDLFQLGAFVKHTEGKAYISGALAYGWQDITTDRTVTVAGLDRLHAAFNANAFSGRIEGGYRVVSPWIGGVGITPYAASQFTTFDLPAYAESVLAGGSNFALSYNSQSVTDSRSEVGFRTDKSYAMPTGVLTLRGRLAWAHDFNPDRNIAATFQTLPGASFVVNGAAQARDSALTTASAEIKWLNGWSAAVTFEGEFSDVTRSYAGKGVVRYAW